MYQVPDQTGRTIVVTGANSGTGKEAARRLAHAGAHVVMAVRTPAKGQAALTEIMAENPAGSLEVRQLDLASLASVEEFARGITDSAMKVDTLVNNAGVMAPPARMLTTDGFELQFGTNFLGPFALTNRLLPTLLNSDAPRVTTMSSGVANFGKINFDDLSWERGYSPIRAYGQSKLADLLFARQLAALAAKRRLNLRSNAAHPGYTQTNLQTAGASLGRDKPKWSPLGGLPFIPSQLPVQGAEPLLFAAADPSAAANGYYGPTGRMSMVGPTGPAKLTRRMSDDATAARLWAEAERLTGVAFPV